MHRTVGYDSYSSRYLTIDERAFNDLGLPIHAVVYVLFLAVHAFNIPAFLARTVNPMLYRNQYSER